MTIAEIKQAIMQDPANQAMTAQGWQPIFTAYPETKILLIGQAPGIKTQLKEDVFRDQSGKKLRQWLNVSEETFYDSKKISVLPLDFYFPGKAKTGDLPPRLDFAEKWHPLLLEQMPQVKLTILIGLYAQKFYLQERAKKTLTATVQAYKEYLPEYFPLPHPSPLNIRWFKNNPYFEAEMVPELQAIVKAALE
ncbi:uracil-DNA glycosylase family protein [Enterococcus lemanii]|uniref:Uracil-DNA glycosylase family protein n=1 Tax=Enterococcus lemanii TaxID=1159752 RepID=A0ABV9MYR9_9ENTE|nr:uracil-DNA glycosylase family protein [Enterococcus lemanii]MBM7708285.1 uracil-DNA glycosylase [Enterococcus lemanii]